MLGALLEDTSSSAAVAASRGMPCTIRRHFAARVQVAEDAPSGSGCCRQYVR